MASKNQDPDAPIVIKKYANRRLYDTQTSTYVTLDDLATMVQAERDFVVYDAKTKEDITRSVLTQIILERETKGDFLLPANFLRQLIRFYGDSMQGYVPSYLEMSMTNLSENQQKFRDQISKTFTNTPLDAMQEQVRKNMSIFENAMRAFAPFGADATNSADEDTTSSSSDTQSASSSDRSNGAASSDDAKAKPKAKSRSKAKKPEAAPQIDELQEQLAAIQSQLNKLK